MKIFCRPSVYATKFAKFAIGFVFCMNASAFGQDALQSSSERHFADVLRHTLDSHPDVRAKRATWEAQKQAAKFSKASGSTRLDLNANAGADRTPPTTTIGASSTQTGASGRASLNLQLPLYDGGETRNATLKQERLANVRLFELQQAQLNAMQDFARAWIDTARFAELIAVTRASLESHEKLLGLLQTRVSSGATRAVDLFQAQSRHAQTKLTLAAEESALEEARTRFFRHSGTMPPLAGHSIEINKNRTPSSWSALLDESLPRAPMLLAASEAAAATNYDLMIAKNAGSPRVALEARHDIAARNPQVKDAGSSSVQLTLSLNLFDSGANRARASEAALKLDASNFQFSDEYAKTEQNLRSAWNDALRFEQAELNSLGSTEFIEKTKDAYRAQYDIGQRSLLDLLNSELEYTSAMRQKINAKADLTNARFRLLILSGRISQQFGISLANELQIEPAPWPQRMLPLNTRVPEQPLHNQVSALATATQPTRPAQQAAVPAAVPASVPVPAAAAPVPVAYRPTASPQPRSPEQIQLLLSQLPVKLNRDLLNWLGSLSSDKTDVLNSSYWSGVSAAAIWGESSKSRLSPTITNLETQSGSDAQQQMQLAIMIRLGNTCVRSAQTWKVVNPNSIDPVWRIARERALEAPLDRC
jgi:outer membrane protein, adhesin transport system